MAEFDFPTLQRDLSRRMDGALEVLHKEFGGLRSGRATTSLLEPVTVDAYGSRMPLSQVGTVGAPEPRMLTVQVWDRGLAKAVERAIMEAGLGLNPQTEGQTIRIPIPPLTEQRRQEFAKVAARYAEEARVAVRNVRRHAMDELKKAERDNAISKDDHRGFSEQVQKMTDSFITKIDEALGHKEAEIMQV